jgi:tryptophan synthase alpha subunit
LKGVEVVAEIAQLLSGEVTVQETGVPTKEIVVDHIAVEQAIQEELDGATHRVSLGNELAKINYGALNLSVVTDEFDDESFDENVDTKAHVEEDDEAGISESDEENV